MKQLYYILIFGTIPIVGFAQEDPLDKIIELASEKSRLEMQLEKMSKQKDSLFLVLDNKKEALDEKDEEISRLKVKESAAETENKNLNAFSKANEKKLQDLQKSIAILKKDSTKMQKYRNQKLDYEKNLQKREAEINDLNAIILERNEALSQVERDKKENFINGKREVLGRVKLLYQQNLDSLITMTTRESVSRDLDLLLRYKRETNDGAVLEVLETLLDYFDAQKLLWERFQKEKVQAAKIKLESFSVKSEKSQILVQTLSRYEAINSGLREALLKIKEYDEKNTANSYSIHQRKLKEFIIPEISDFIFNYDFQFKDYPFLTENIMKVIKIKQGDSNADITELIDDLK